MNRDSRRILNDMMRTGLVHNGDTLRITVSQGVKQLEKADQLNLMKEVSKFDEFNGKNDPYLEHDMGEVQHLGERYYFKFSYYDYKMESFGDDITVMHVFRKDEY